MADTFLNDIQIIFTPGTPFLSGNSAFFQSVNGPPGLMLSGDPPYTGTVFEIDVTNNATPGVYHGAATILGGPSPGDMNAVSNTAPFTVVITPEPAPGSLMLLGLAALIVRGIWKRRMSFP